MRSIPAFLLPLTLLLIVACGGAGPEPAPVEEPVGERVENPSLGVVIGALPPSLQVLTNEEGRLELKPKDGNGTLQVVVDPPETGGINLVAAHREHKEAIEAKGGSYKGRLELGSPFGTTFLSRGVYSEEGRGSVEEAIIFVIHPWQDRRLSLVYRYPAPGPEVEDPNAYSKALLEGNLFELLGEMEGLPAPAGTES